MAASRGGAALHGVPVRGHDRAVADGWRRVAQRPLVVGDSARLVSVGKRAGGILIQGNPEGNTDAEVQTHTTQASPRAGQAGKAAAEGGAPPGSQGSEAVGAERGRRGSG